MFSVLAQCGFSQKVFQPYLPQKRLFFNISNNTFFDMFQGSLIPVDYPPSEAGEGRDAYLRTVSTHANVVVFYKNALWVSNVTPNTLHLLRKRSKRRVFYLSHYYKLYKNGQNYTIQLFWPVWVGKAPRGVLTRNLPGWYNPYRKGRWQDFQVGEFAFINLLYLPPYENQWEPLDFTRSPFNREEAEFWWREFFLGKMLIKDPSRCFGYSIYRFRGGGKVPHAYIPGTAPLHEETFKEETDRYKKTMVNVLSHFDDIPERYWWTPQEAAEIPLIRKWTFLGLGIQNDPLVIPSVEKYLPDGKWMDPFQENIREYFEKWSNPRSYWIKCNFPIDPVSPGEDFMKHRSVDDDSTKPRKALRPSFNDEDYSGSDTDSEEEFERLSKDCWERADKIQMIADKYCEKLALRYFRFQNAFYKWEDEEEAAHEFSLILMKTRLEHGLTAYPKEFKWLVQEEREAFEKANEESDWSSSDEEGYHSYSWLKWGDPRKYRQFGGPEDDIADDLLEDWATILREERGDSNDEIDWAGIAKSNYDDLPPARPDKCQTPPSVFDRDPNPFMDAPNPFQGVFPNPFAGISPDFSFKSYYFWRDPRHEE